jgi:replicative DNA helicase
MRFETLILHKLVTDPDYLQKFAPYLKPDLFPDPEEKQIFIGISNYYRTYNTAPNDQVIISHIDKLENLDQAEYDSAVEYVKEIFRRKDSSAPQWLMNETVDFIRKGVLHQAVIEFAKEYNNPKKLTHVLDELNKAASFTMDEETPGSDLDWEPLFEHLQSANEIFPFSTDIMTQQTDGGIMRKTICVIEAPTSTGKTLIQCSESAHWLRLGRNVLYISVEMSEESIKHRIYANIHDTEMSALRQWTRQTWQNATLPKLGRFKVRTWPPKSAHAGHFEQYLDDLKRKENFVPDIICVDYLGECLPKRHLGKNSTSYDMFGEIISNLRAIAVKYNVALLTAAQTNREGYEADPSLKNVGQSYQINSAADLIIGIQKEDTIPHRLRFKVLKNRDRELLSQLVHVGVERAKMKLFDPNDLKTVQAQLTNFQKPKAKPNLVKASKPIERPSVLDEMFGEELAS